MPTHETFTPDVINQIIPTKRQEIHSAKSHVGLQLIASTAGSRTLAVQYNLDGKTVRMNLLQFKSGKLTQVEFDAAYMRAQQVRADAEQGNNPVGEVKAARRARRIEMEAERFTVGSAISDYQTSAKYRKLKSNTQQTYDMAIRKWIVPGLGQTKILDLSPQALLEFYNFVTSNGIKNKGTARHCIIILRNTWNFASAFGKIPFNITPPFHGHSILNPDWNKVNVRSVDFSNDDIRELWAQTYKYDYELACQTDHVAHGYYGAAIRFALTSGLRKTNVMKLTHEQVADGKIFIPAGQMKSGRDFTVPINQVAKSVLDSLQNPILTAEPFRHQSEYVFGRHDAVSTRIILEAVGASAPVNRRKPVTITGLPLGDPNLHLRKIARDAGIEVDKLTFHALRKTYARVVDEACDFYTVKRFLGHGLANDVTSGYLLRSEGLNKQAQAIGRRFEDILGLDSDWKYQHIS